MKSLRVLMMTGLLVMPGLLAGGCGYGSGGDGGGSFDNGYQWRSLYRSDVKTVAVPTFVTKDFRRGYELRLSKAVVNSIEAITPYKVAPRDRADTVLEGEIVSISSNVLSEQRETAVPQEQLITVTVNLTWKDLRSGRILMERRNFEQTAQYYPTLGEGEFVGSQQAIERLAVSIVQEMQADW